MSDVNSELMITYDKQTNSRTVSNVPPPRNQTQSASGSDGDIMSELLKEFKELKINMLNSINKVQTEASRPSYNNKSRIFTCFKCGETGHKQYECTKEGQSDSQVASGPNAIPLGQSVSHEDPKKANEHRL
ncbi:hypothetical protein [Parasitella parasitica]|uniref:CCHC-type domain-containing protein n=1 Tax=Parasitella parasitica TaxID=35722 RepID=A0A0B7N0J7_9FUNG|nr:hypothetical protein [Parasitella parasitica]